MRIRKSAQNGCAVIFAILVMPAWAKPPTGSVIFIHPDGASAAAWAAARALYHGPDGDLNWDQLPAIALYRGHISDSLTATSNAGGTVHAYGVKVGLDAYGRSAGGKQGQDLTDDEGHSLSVAKQALRQGLPVGLVQSGITTEPGTGCFLASVERREDHEHIAAQLIESGADVLLGGGEQFFLPSGTSGTYGPGVRSDGRNLIEEAVAAGYTIVRTRDALLHLPPDTNKVLGLFSSYHTFNDRTEEELEQAKLPCYQPDAPTIAEMTRAALRVLEHKNKRFLLIVEEEGTDNFGNHNNASGMLEAMHRADEAIGVARAYLKKHPSTLIVTTADSDAGGMRMRGWDSDEEDAASKKLPAHDKYGSPLDGQHGSKSIPFVAAPDRTGRRLLFTIVWACRYDVSGGILVRAEGLNSELVRGSFDNTQIAEIIRTTLFGTPSQ